jgi:BirA family transcriptional regulator, biotin operon repressor / biotin---[acetyl-CoA-carboxylase] ligase
VSSAGPQQSAYDLPALEASLAGTIFAGKLQFSAVTGSTNTDAMLAARAGAPHGSVFFADEQNAGRGRGDHAWHSPAGEGLYVSVLFRPRLSLSRLAFLPFAAGLAAAHAIRETAGLAVDLRWPNDLLVGPRKVGGLLVESSTEGGKLAFAVVGVGVNVHQRSFDPALSTPGTSLDVETGRSNPRQALLIALLKALALEAAALQDRENVEEILRRVEAASTWILGRRVVVHGPQACAGVTAGLDANGFLRVETPTGLVTVQTGGIRAADIS